jgi:hypothetical protein
LRVEFKSEAVFHFGQNGTMLARLSDADNGAVHAVAINALTVFDVAYVRWHCGIHCPDKPPEYYLLNPLGRNFRFRDK